MLSTQELAYVASGLPASILQTRIGISPTCYVYTTFSCYPEELISYYVYCEILFVFNYIRVISPPPVAFSLGCKCFCGSRKD